MDAGTAPAGLSDLQQAALVRYAELAALMTAAELVAAAREHLRVTLRAYAGRPAVNLQRARTICERIEAAVAGWDQLETDGRRWLGAATLYFAISNDPEPDYAGDSGFDDDAQVLASCLRFAGRDDLCGGLT